MSKEKQRWYQFHIRVIKNNQNDHGYEGLRGGTWYAIWFNKAVIIELEDGSSGKNKKLQKSIPKSNLEAGEFVQEHIYKMISSWEVKVSHGKIWFKN